MTLLTTEIHNYDNPTNAMIVFAADRRISRGCSHAGSRKKIFKHEDMNVGIGYFGLAEVQGNSDSNPMDVWITEFLRATSDIGTLNEFAIRLSEKLNMEVPMEHRRSVVSGFHVAGFNEEGRPEFWYVRNISDNGLTFLGEYQAREDFQRRDRSNLPVDGFQVYRNGDIRAHVLAWERIDQALGGLLNNDDFRQIRAMEDYVEWVRYKMEIIAQFYEKYCVQSIIGTPVDAFAIKSRCTAS